MYLKEWSDIFIFMQQTHKNSNANQKNYFSEKEKCPYFTTEELTRSVMLKYQKRILDMYSKEVTILEDYLSQQEHEFAFPIPSHWRFQGIFILRIWKKRKIFSFFTLLFL